MSTFLKIYGVMCAFAVIAALSDRILLKKKNSLLAAIATYGAEFYFAVSAVRTLTGSGYDFVSFTFWGKELQGYIKVIVLLAVIYIIGLVLSKLLRDVYDRFVSLWAGIFAALASLHIVFLGQLRMRITLLIGVIAAVLSLIAILIKLTHSEEEKKTNYILTISQTLFFTILYYVVGPLELYAYNSDDFLYGLADFYPLLLVGSLVFIFFTTVLVTEFLPKQLYKIYIIMLAGYNIISYIQSFFLNGKMSELDGSKQAWSTGKIVVNIVIWIALAAAIVSIAFFYKNWKKVYIGAAAYVVLIQIFTLIYIFLTTGAVSARTMQVTEEGSFTVSSDENVMVLLLDAYDTQFIDKVLEDDPDYLEPLKDFTYFNNMESRYYYTDFSLPYLLTAPSEESLDVTDKAETYPWYEGADFLKRIKGYGYDINILTERKYIKNFPDGLVSNYVSNGYCILDAEKTMDIFSDCMRYKHMPFAIKDMYRYEIFDLMNVLTDTNIYKMGTDDKIDAMIKENGLEVRDDCKAFRFYHLYGAHAPYYVTENNEMDYNSCNPRAQFRGCLLTVYDCIEALKKNGLYDNTTIIIMADHGLNPGQVDALTDAGETCDASKSNPIFFIKQKGENRDSMEINDKRVSHDQYFDTLMKCIDPSLGGDYYGSIWD